MQTLWDRESRRKIRERGVPANFFSHNSQKFSFFWNTSFMAANHSIGSIGEAPETTSYLHLDIMINRNETNLCLWS